MVGISNSVDMSLSKLREVVQDREAWRAAVHEGAQTQQLNNSTFVTNEDTRVIDVFHLMLCERGLRPNAPRLPTPN